MGGCLGGSCEVGESLLYTLSAYIRLLWQDGDQVALVVLTEARAGMRDPFPRPWETPSERPMSIHYKHAPGPTHINCFIGSISMSLYL